MTAGLLLGLAASTGAQTPANEVSGRVTDTTGAALARAVVSAESELTRQPITTRSNSAGDYQLGPLAPGTYRITFSAAGYRSLVREGVEMIRGLTLDVSLDAFPMRGELFVQERLDDMPSARDPWAILNQTAAVVMADGVNVGGSASGQQLTPAARGQHVSNVTWTLDGASLTDLVAVGSSPIYFDFGALDSIHVTTAGGDASQQASGIAVRLTTRSGANTTSGSVRGWLSSDWLEASNVTPDLFAQGTGAGVPLNWYHEYGAEAGGPLVRNKLWWWAGSGVQDINGTVLGFYQVASGCPPAASTFDTLSDTQSCLAPDRTRLTTSSGSIRARPSASQLITFTSGRDEKTRNARQASSLTAIESTARQTGVTPRFTLRDLSTFGGRFVLDSQVSHIGGNFTLGFQTPDLADTQVFVDLATGATSRSLINAQTNKRPLTEVRTDGTFVLPSVSGGDHALKFGLAYRRVPYSLEVHTGGNVVAYYNGATPAWAVLYRDGIDAVRIDTASAYLQDTSRLGRLVVTGGARWDLQKDRASAASVPANPLAPTILPAATFAGAAPPVDFSDIAPRVSASYDITGAGKSVVSASYGIYFGQGISLARALSLTGPVTAVVLWSDPNHDRIVQANEMPVGAFAQFSSNFNVNTGLEYPTANTIDPSLKNSRTRESVVSLDQELTRDLNVSVSYVHRTYDRFIWSPHVGDISGLYVAKTWTDPPSGLTGTYYELGPGEPLSSATSTTNQPGRYLTYQGLDLGLRKRFGDRWTMNAALTLQSSKDHWPSGSYTDPTDISKLDGQPGDPNLPRYLAKLNGRVALPWGLGVSATANVQDGFIRNIVFNGPPHRSGVPFTTLLVAAPGTTRYPALTMVDAQVDKTVRLGHRAQVRLSVIAFNALNASTVLAQSNNRSSPTFGSVLSLVGPRVVRFGATVAF